MAGQFVTPPTTPPVANPIDVFVNTPLDGRTASDILGVVEKKETYSIASVGADNTYAPVKSDETHSIDPGEVGADTVFHANVSIEGGTRPTIRFEPGAKVCHVYTTMGDRSVRNSDTSRHTISQLRELYLIVDVFQALDAVVAGRRPSHVSRPVGHPFDSSTWPRAGFTEVYSPSIVAERSLSELASRGTTALRELQDGTVVQLGRFGGRTDRDGFGNDRWSYETGWVELPADAPPIPSDGWSRESAGAPLVDDPAGVLRYIGNWDFPTARKLINATDIQGSHHGDTEALACLLFDERWQVRREAAWAVTRFAGDRYPEIIQYLEENGHPEVRRAIRDARRTRAAEEVHPSD